MKTSRPCPACKSNEDIRAGYFNGKKQIGIRCDRCLFQDLVVISEDMQDALGNFMFDIYQGSQQVLGKIESTNGGQDTNRGNAAKVVRRATPRKPKRTGADS